MLVEDIIWMSGQNNIRRVDKETEPAFLNFFDVESETEPIEFFLKTPGFTDPQVVVTYSKDMLIIEKDSNVTTQLDTELGPKVQLNLLEKFVFNRNLFDVNNSIAKLTEGFLHIYIPLGSNQGQQFQNVTFNVQIPSGVNPNDVTINVE